MKPIFRNAMFGFNKEDVFNFMTKQNKQYESKVADLSAQLENQAAEFEKERAQFDCDLAELETLRASEEETKVLLDGIKELAEQILNDQTKISSCVSVIKSEKESDRVKLLEMEKRVVEAEKLRVKAEKFDQLSGVLSSIFNQPEISAETEAPAESAPVVESGEESAAVCELIALVTELASRCEKLQGMFCDDENA